MTLKRILAIFLLAMTAVLCGCAKEEQPTEPTAAPAVEETSSPYIDTPVDEPEWTLAQGGALTLEDGAYLYAEGGDFLYFAIVGSTAEDMELRFKLDDITADMLRQQDPDNRYFITFNGEKIGSATLSSDCSVAIVKGQHTYEEMTSLATRIRGLEE